MPDSGFDPGGNPSDPFSGIDVQQNANILYYAFLTLLNILIAVINFLWRLIILLYNVMVFVFRTVLKFLLHIWTTYIKRAVTWLASHVQKLRAWLKRTITPIIKRLEKIKQWYDQHILKQQLRILQMIQVMRRFLAILRLFHIKFANVLDQALADIQNRIQQNIALVRGTLNQIINTLSLVLDPQLLIFRNVLGGSLLGNVGAIKRIVGYGDGRLFSASEAATIDKDHSRYFASTVNTHIKTLVSTGPTDDDKARRTAFRSALADATNTALPS